MYEYRIIGTPKVIDGDTLSVMFDIGFNIQTFERCRLKGVDAPESRTTDLKEKKYGLESKEFVENWLKSNTDLWGRTTKDDKYGRMLVEIFNNSSECLNQSMIDRGYAWEYDGGNKSKDFDLLEQKRKQFSEANQPTL